MEGLEELLVTLSALGGNIKDATLNGIHRGAKRIQANAKLLAPVKTGQLRNAIKTRAEKTIEGAHAQVYTNLNYAVYVEFGTGQRGKSSNIERPKRSTLQSKLEGNARTTLFNTSLFTCKEQQNS